MSDASRHALCPVPTEVRPSVYATVDVARAHFRSRLRAVYVVGSVAYGGFVPGWSDIDIEIIVSDGDAIQERRNAETARTVRRGVHQRGHTRVDVKCYSSRVLEFAARTYRYGIRNRIVMLRESGLLVVGASVLTRLPTPDIESLRAEGLGVAVGLGQLDDHWWDSRPADDLAALLALPMRLLITSRTGSVVGKGHALQRTLTDWNDAWPMTSLPWVSWAMLCRSEPAARELSGPARRLCAAAARRFLGSAAVALDDRTAKGLLK